MIQIRQNVFETNSSSVHSLVIEHDNFFYTPNYQKYFTCNLKKDIKGGYFGRSGIHVLYSQEEKLNYIWTGIIDYYIHIDWENEKVFFDSDSDFYTFKEMLEKIAPKCNFIFDEKRFLDDYDIGIDHVDSLGAFLQECLKQPDLLKDLILNDNSYIIVAGDEGPFIVDDFGVDYWLADEHLKVIKEKDNFVRYLYVKGN